jgi:hypothetical protein
MPLGTSGYPEYDALLPFQQSFLYGTGVGQAKSYTIQQTNSAVVWVFKEIAVENNNAASASTTATLYLNNVLLSPSTYLIPTTNGLGITADGLPYIPLLMSDQLTISIAGATIGDQITIQGLYTEILAR